MPTVQIYTSPHCPFCHHAKTLLREKNITFQEIDVSLEPQYRQEMITKAQGRRTVPQIFINGKGIGGCDDLYALDRQGKLSNILKETE